MVTGCLYRVEADAARQEAGRAAAEVSRLEAGLREVRGKLEQRRSDSNSQKSQSAIGQALMQAKASGKIPGIYGRLGTHRHFTPSLPLLPGSGCFPPATC